MYKDIHELNQTFLQVANWVTCTKYVTYIENVKENSELKC